MTTCANSSNPCRKAYIDWAGQNGDRWSWDPITIMIAVRGLAGAHSKEVNHGWKNTVEESGKEDWRSDTKYNMGWVGNTDGVIRSDIDDLLCRAPGPPPKANGWVKTSGFNCYGTRDGGRTYHGATDLETPASASAGRMSVKECQVKCDEMSNCTGITVNNRSGDCYRKGDINLDQCDNNGGGTILDTYVKGDWIAAKKFNCYGTRDGGRSYHGATDLEKPASSSCGTMSLDACKAKCKEMPGCNAVTVLRKSNGEVECFRKGNVVLGQCD